MDRLGHPLLQRVGGSRLVWSDPLLWIGFASMAVCRLRTQVIGDKVDIAQALVALEQGASTDIWLAMLKQ